MKSRPGFRRVLPWAFAAVALLLVSGYAVISLFTADRLTRPTNYPLQIDPRRLSSDALPWSVRTTDGVTLRGWYLPTAERRRLIVLVHGMWSSWLEMAALGRDLHHGGYDVLLFDLRGHGQSDPSRLTLGRQERGRSPGGDELGQDRGVQQRPHRLAGLLHGRIDLAAGGRAESQHPGRRDGQPLRQPARACSKQQLSKHSHLPGWFNPGILTAARWIYGVRTDDLVPIKAARSWGNRPLLADPRRVRFDRPGEPGLPACRRRGVIVPDAHAAGRGARSSLPDQSPGVCLD